MPSAADRNLLFGILALQMDFVTRDALIAAMHAWILDKAKPLGQILRDQGALGQDEHALLDALVQKHLERHGNDPEKSLASLSSLGSARDELQHIADPDVQASLARVAADRVDEDDPHATRPPAVGASTSEGLRFRILRPHAEGGLGKVSVAEDRELHREVALKEIKERHADDPESRTRFLIEAEITGGLEHPGIVPVYGLGHYGDGRPFYAMRFIRGDSLKDAIERFHEADKPGRDPGERALELRKLLGRFVDVCDAIAYAHSRGVLHRDLKPGNVMLGQYGETLVVDWGLAKAVGKAESQATSPEPTLRPRGAGGSAETLPGSAIGTPAYMSPEQAAGQLDRLGPASDVYSLGATLYCLLTGRAPFEKEDVWEVLQRVQRGEYPRPRALKPVIPVALEAICLKAMAIRPEDRYRTPRELAEDIEQSLADEPVTAYREPVARRVGRWVRRHRVLVGTGAAVSAVVVTVVVASLLVAAAREREEEAQGLRQIAVEQRDDADFQRQRTEVALQQAQEAKRREAIALEQLAQASYLRQVNLAHLEWKENNVARAVTLLEDCQPARRHWEWDYVHRLCHGSLLTLKGHTGFVGSVCFSSDGQRLASASGDQTVKVWDAATGQEALTLKGHNNGVLCVCFSPDGQRLASASHDKTVKVWDAATGQEAFTLKGHTGAVYSVSFSPDGKRLASASVDQTVKVWDVATGQEALTLKRHTSIVLSVCFSPDGRRLASAAADQTVKVWDVATGQEALTLKGHTDGVDSVCFSPDGKRLASASWDQTVKVWDAATGQEALTLKGHTHYVNSVCFSPDGRRLASASRDQTVKVWDTATGQEALTLKGHTHYVNSVCFSPDGRRLASASVDKTVKVWDAATGQVVLTLKGDTRDFTSVCFSADGRRLASASYDQTVQVWDAATGQETLTLKGHTAGVLSVCFSPDGRRLASASVDKTVKVWDTATSQEALTLKGHTYYVNSVCFSPDGKRLASASGDQTVRVWETEIDQDTLGKRVRAWQREQAQVAERDSHWFAAAFHLLHLIQDDPANPALRLRHCGACVRLGRWKEAAADLVEACKLLTRKP